MRLAEPTYSFDNHAGQAAENGYFPSTIAIELTPNLASLKTRGLSRSWMSRVRAKPDGGGSFLNAVNVTLDGRHHRRRDAARRGRA